MTPPKSFYTVYLALRGLGAMGVGAVVVLGLAMGAAIYGEVQEKLASLQTDTPVAGIAVAGTVSFPADTAALETMGETLNTEVMPAAGGTETPAGN